jgi:hypothetical protein
MSPQEECPIVKVLREGEATLCHLTREPQLGSHYIIARQPLQDGRKKAGLVGLLAKLEGS